MGIVTSVTDEKVYIREGEEITGYDRSLFDFVPVVNGKIKIIRKDDEISFRPAKSVNRILYILVAFFLGMLGVHRFIAGHWIAGLFYLAFFILGLVLTFVFGLGFFILAIEELVVIYDIVRAAFASADVQGNISV